MKVQKIVKFNMYMSCILLGAVVLMLVATSFAYFTDTKQVTNTLTVGNVSIEQIEMERGENGALVNFTQDKPLYPAVNPNMDWAEDFLKQLKAPLDFFSWHIYAYDPEWVRERALQTRKLLDQYGFQNAESILNEWNYVKGWIGDEWLYSLRAEKSLKGAAFIAAVMSTCQKLPLDLLMYYDARPCAMNGMFNTDWVCDKLKGYSPFYAVNVLYQLGTEVETAALGEKLYVCAAKKDGEGAIMLTYYTDDDAAADTQVAVDISKFSETGAEASYYLLDEDHDLELVRTETFAAGQFQTFVQLPRWGTMLIKLRQR